eukprot:CAMPEP_0117429656 /NCGR_PEP_ID=MMETSP0758-20121206/9182_1 /TAXON_ID=63605 /ORGANISM="Percolomonas cosmopolitus, Strain AE-1 (ATCC 50343)" /LENGTH=111 /DNA_ID=CAMNT_0005216867 /DNA_START=315 /DNA_END=647 /DNA_ORIENTATION=+
MEDVMHEQRIQRDEFDRLQDHMVEFKNRMQHILVADKQLHVHPRRLSHKSTTKSKAKKKSLDERVDQLVDDVHQLNSSANTIHKHIRHMNAHVNAKAQFEASQQPSVANEP